MNPNNLKTNLEEQEQRRRKQQHQRFPETYDAEGNLTQAAQRALEEVEAAKQAAREAFPDNEEAYKSAARIKAVEIYNRLKKDYKKQQEEKHKPNQPYNMAEAVDDWWKAETEEEKFGCKTFSEYEQVWKVKRKEKRMKLGLE